MARKRKWIVGFLAVVALAIAVTLFVSIQLSKCRYSESAASYTEDKGFYYQMQFTLCDEDAKSNSRLVMGEVGTKKEVVILEFGPSLGELKVSWQEGPELQVEASEFAIKRRWGPYEDLPRVVITSH